jgi:hypothetical protein
LVYFHAFVGPAILSHAHPLSALGGAMNGIVLDAVGGPQSFLGPGAGPDVTAATLLDDVFEMTGERAARVAPAEQTRKATLCQSEETSWLLKIEGCAAPSEMSELLGSFGVWCSRVIELDGWSYALAFPASSPRVDSAVRALQAATGFQTHAIAVLGEGAAAC